MVTVVQGRLGSGKSFDMCRMMCEHLLKGGAVRTNMLLDFPRLQRDHHRRLASWQYGTLDVSSNPETIPTGDRRGHGRRRVLVVLDEALNWFETDGRGSDPRRETWGRWLRQSDKLGQDVFFVAQDFSRAAKWIRELAALMFEMVPFRNITWMGIPWGRLPFFRSIYARRVWDVRSKSVLSWSLRRYSAYWGRYYDTAALYGFEGADNVYDSGVVFPAHRPIVFAPCAVALVEVLQWFV